MEINKPCYVFNLLAISASVNLYPDWQCNEMLYWYVYLQNWEMGASICAAAPLLEFSFWTWVGGTGLCDWPVARYMACTHRMRSCSSSLAKITVSPSFTALKKARPPSRPAHTEKKCQIHVHSFCQWKIHLKMHFSWIINKISKHLQIWNYARCMKSGAHRCKQRCSFFFFTFTMDIFH